MHRISRVLALSSVLGPLALGSTALAHDGSEASLTGIWEGTYVCDDSQAGVQVNFVADDRVESTQEDGLLRLRRVTQDGADSLLYEGPVVALASSERFEAMVSVCGGSYIAKEMVRLRRVQVNEDGTGSFDAESLYESADAPGFSARASGPMSASPPAIRAYLAVRREGPLQAAPRCLRLRCR